MNIDRKLLDAYYEGRCTPEEKQAVEAFFMEEELADYQVEPSPDTEQVIWEAVQQRIQRTKSNRMIYRWLGAAAIALVGFSLLYIFLIKNNAVQEVEMIYVSTGATERLQVVLPDSSVVHLNRNSSLRYPARFDSLRVVYLEGEGFFDVRKMPTKPFVVEGSYASTRVLGTSFNLEERLDKQTLTVSSGKVRYHPHAVKDAFTVLPNERVARTTGGQFRKEAVYAGRYTGWTAGKLQFSNNSLNEIVQSLEDWYAVEITIRDSKLAHERFTGQYVDASLQDVLKSLSYSLHFTYKKEQNIIMLYPE